MTTTHQALPTQRASHRRPSRAATEITVTDWYVYVYRDPETLAIRYVGKGIGGRVDKIVRSVFHGSGEISSSTDKVLVRAWMFDLRRRRLAPLVELMRCDTEEQALAVEAAMISALWTSGALLNKIHGQKHSFTPLGVPDSCAHRAAQPPLSRDDVLALGGAIIVYVSPEKFTTGDIRSGALPVIASTAEQAQRHLDGIHARSRRWWQMGQHVERWAQSPDDAPGTLLAVTGPVDRRWIWAAIALDRSGWNRTADNRQPQGLYELPTRKTSGVTPAMLDVKGLRGRIVAPGHFGPVVEPDGRRHFGANRSQFFDVVTP